MKKLTIILAFIAIAIVTIWSTLARQSSAQAGGCPTGQSLYAHRGAGSSSSLPIDCTMNACRQIRAHTTGSANLGCLPVIGCIGQVNWNYIVTGLNKAGSPNCPTAVNNGPWTL